MNIVLLGSQQTEPDCTHWAGLRSAFVHFTEHTYYEIDCRKTTPQTVLAILQAITPQIIIYGINDPILQGLHVKVRELLPNAKIALWFCEMRDERTGGYPEGNLAPYLDAIFLTNDGLLAFYKAKTGVPAYYLPQAVQPTLLPPNGADNGQIVFIGGRNYATGFWGSRAEYLKTANNYFGGRCRHYDGGTQAERNAYYRAMPQLYGEAAIVLDISHDWTVSKYCSNRYFVIPGMGGLSLTKRFPGCEEIYPEGYGKVYFESPEEMVAKASELLKQPEKRLEIKQRGWEWCKAHHTYQHRIKFLLATL